jgi:hypothetical protein
MKVYCGIDNGVSGSIGIVGFIKPIFVMTPVKSVQNYQKTAKKITRIDFKKLTDMLEPFRALDTKIFLERPLVNPGRFLATSSALRSFEATLICIEELGLSYEFLDSKQWQKKMLPEGLKGADAQKMASRDVGTRMFPQFAELICKHKDADGLLIAEWARRENL